MDLGAADDPDPVDQRLEECFAGWRVASGDYVSYLRLEQAHVGVRERLRLVVLVDGQLVTPGLEAAQLLGQLGDPSAAGAFGHGALLEGAEVAIERVAGSGRRGSCTSRHLPTR